MSIQRNVAQQIAPRREEIERVVAYGASGACDDPWLLPMLVAHGMDPSQGILADLSHWPEGGHACGLWLTADGRFHRFEVEILDDGAPVVVEQFEDVTTSIEVDGHRRGIGATFGFLALDALQRRLGQPAGAQGPATA